MTKQKVLLGAFIICALQLSTVYGHGRLVKPPARGTAWRKGFSTPRDWTDNEENCGGFGVQWNINNGMCGICGDPWHAARENETPGKYATGKIVANYKQGEVIEVAIEITSNHKGWVEFRLCENNDKTKDKDQTCFDKHLLEFAGEFNGLTRAKLGQGKRVFSYKVKLPSGVKCEQCILQWHYNAGNAWGVDRVTGEGCVGCGPQETFRGCADVTIAGDGSDGGSSDGGASDGGASDGGASGGGSSDGGSSGGGSSGGGSSDGGSSGGGSSDGGSSGGGSSGGGSSDGGSSDGGSSGGGSSGGGSSDGGSSDGGSSGGGSSGGVDYLECVGVEPWKSVPGMDKWCVDNCNLGNCPASHCSCKKVPADGSSGSGRLECIAIEPWRWVPGMDGWCEDNCNAGYCPKTHCSCG